MRYKCQRCGNDCIVRHNAVICEKCGREISKDKADSLKLAQAVLDQAGDGLDRTDYILELATKILKGA